MESLKKYLIRGIATIPSIEGMEKNKIILVTSCGLIIGEIMKSTDDLSLSNAFFTSVDTLTSMYLEDNKLSPDSVPDGNDGYILLKNVTIKNNTGDINLPILCVFYDQIIGATIGNSN